jgi:hypothetical protein
MDEIKGFARVAPYLSDPLVLVGFALLLLFLLFRSLIGSGLIPVLEQEAGGRVVESILDYRPGPSPLSGFLWVRWWIAPRRFGGP